MRFRVFAFLAIIVSGIIGLFYCLHNPYIRTISLGMSAIGTYLLMRDQGQRKMSTEDTGRLSTNKFKLSPNVGTVIVAIFILATSIISISGSISGISGEILVYGYVSIFALLILYLAYYNLFRRKR